MEGAVNKAPAANSNSSSNSDLKESQSETSVHLENIATEQNVEYGQEVSTPLNSPRDPRNWPKWKKDTQIWMIAFHSMVSTFMAGGIIPAFQIMAEQYGTTVTEASYLTSVQILLLGVAPLIWKPIASRYGRYHVCLISVLGSMLCNIGGAKCTTFGSQMATRVLTAFFISPPMGIGSGVVTDLSSPEERAQKLGWWTLLSTIGSPGGPFIMGFVTEHLGISWIFWIFAIINFCQLIAYLFLGAETLYIERDVSKDDSAEQDESFFKRLLPRKIDPRPLTVRDVLLPFSIVRYPRILIPAIAHSVAFCYANIAIIVEMPIVYGEKFEFNAQQIGLQFIAVIIGCVLGEQLSGPMSDYFLKTRYKKKGHTCPADRLWLVYIGFGTIFAGLLTWGFQLEHAKTWNVTPCVGAAIASFGNQVQTTILLAFAVDSHREYSTSIGILINFCRLVYAFCGPFYLPYMFQALGLAGAYGVMCVIVAVAALIPTIAIQIVAAKSTH